MLSILFLMLLKMELFLLFPSQMFHFVYRNATDFCVATLFYLLGFILSFFYGVYDFLHMSSANIFTYFPSWMPFFLPNCSDYDFSIILIRSESGHTCVVPPQAVCYLQRVPQYPT